MKKMIMWKFIKKITEKNTKNCFKYDKKKKST